MHYEVFNSVTEVIARETKIKGRNRLKREQLIEEHNPYWEELASTLNK
jgi:predicted GIY-YIG superfamily endonuclease